MKATLCDCCKKEVESYMNPIKDFQGKEIDLCEDCKRALWAINEIAFRHSIKKMEANYGKLFIKQAHFANRIKAFMEGNRSKVFTMFGQDMVDKMDEIMKLEEENNESPKQN